ncbi:hypothetical protein HOG98_04835 [bacterium]|nr:hypothetical protein [bacterium]
MGNENKLDSQSIPFLDDVFFKPQIEDANYLGVKKNLHEEIFHVKRALEHVSRYGVTTQDSQKIVSKIQNLVQFSERQSQDVREQILVSLLGFFTFAVKAPNKDPDIISEVLKFLVGWGIQNFFKDDEPFFVFSILETISSNFSILSATQLNLLIGYEGLLVQLASNEDDEKIRIQANVLLNKLGLFERKEENDRAKLPTSSLEKVTELQESGNGIKITHPLNQKDLVRKEFDEFHKLRVISGEPKIAQASQLIFEYLHYFKYLFSSLCTVNESMFSALTIILIQERSIHRLFDKFESPSIALIADKFGLVSEQTSVLSFVHILEIDPIHRVKSFVDGFQGLLDSGVHTIFVLLPDSRIWLSAHYAKDAAEGIESQIKIIDSKTFDFGIGVIFQEASKLVIKKCPMKDVYSRIYEIIGKLRYWVYVDSDEIIKNKMWYSKMLERSKVKKIPKDKGCVLGLHRGLGLIDTFNDAEEGIIFILNRLAVVVRKTQKIPDTIYVKHKGYAERALKVARLLKTEYPSASIQIVNENELLGSNFDQHIGICVV